MKDAVSHDCYDTASLLLYMSLSFKNSDRLGLKDNRTGVMSLSRIRMPAFGLALAPAGHLTFLLVWRLLMLSI